MQYPISNDWLKVSSDGHSETQLLPKLLLQVYVQELHDIMVSPPEECVIKEAKDAENNINLSDYMLRIIMIPQPNNMHTW